MSKKQGKLKCETTNITQVRVKRKQACNIKREDEYLFERAMVYESKPIVIDHYKGVSVTADQYLWKRGVFLNETFWLRQGRQKKGRLKLLLQIWLRQRRQVVELREEGIWIVDAWSHGYFHWFCDVLQRWFILKDYLPGVPIAIPEGYLKVSYVSLTLHSLQIPYLVLEENKINKFQNLHVMPGRLISGNYDEGAIAEVSRNLRERLTLQNTDGTRVLYVSRASANLRRVLNEDELKPIFGEYGVEMIRLEELSWLDQVKKLEGVTLIIGMHGAGLTNMLFLSRGASIIEFRHPKSIMQNCYFSLASALDMSYYYLIGKPVDLSDPHKSDIIVDPVKLRNLLGSALS